MDKQNNKIKIVFGGWYQRTTLHLTEIYDFFSCGKSALNLDVKKLKELQNSLNLKETSREAGFLEIVKAITNDGISIRYHEDGLYILETFVDDYKEIKKAKQNLENYFTEKLNPAISYIFSLGAPTPKVLANIKTVHPTAVMVVDKNPEKFEIDIKEFGEIYSKIISKDIVVYKTPTYIFVASNPKTISLANELVDMQIFFREFKDQLQKYLNIHRNLWEEIAAIKNQENIHIKEIDLIRDRLDNYQTTINLINNRINQMSSYVRTRSSIASKLKIEEYLINLFEYKFEVLSDSLEYIKEIWDMTIDYLNSAIQNVVELKNQSTARGIESLRILTSISVVSGIIGYFAATKLPTITSKGVVYFTLVLTLAYITNFIFRKIYEKKKYKFKLKERITDI